MQDAACQTSRRRDWLLLALLLLIGAGVKGWVWHSATVLTRDGIGFIEYASRLRQEPLAEVLRTTKQHPLYPLHIYGVAQAYQACVDRPLDCYDWEFCAHLANVWTGVLLAVPMYFMGKLLGGPVVGFGAALLFQVMPVPVRVTADTLTEGLYLLSAACALWSALHGLEARRWPWFLLAGVCGGLCYLTRPEGALVPLAIVVTLLLLRVRGQETSWLRAGRCALAVSAATLAVVAPYWLTIGGLSKKTTFDLMVSRTPDLPQRLAEKPSSGGGLLLASRFQPGVDGEEYHVTVSFVLREVGKEVSKGFHYVLWLPALIGLGTVIRRARCCPGEAHLWLLPILCAGNLVILVWLGWKAHYVSERHTMLLVMAGCIPAMAALQAGAARWCRQRPQLQGREFQTLGFVVSLFVGFGLFQSLQPLHEHRLGHRKAGEWLAREWQEGDRLVDPYGWVSFYSGQRTPPRPPSAIKGRLFWVLEDEEKDQLRVDIINLVRRKQDSTPCFSWTVTTDRRVLVYVIPPRVEPAALPNQAAKVP